MDQRTHPVQAAVDVGDIVGAVGGVKRTEKGELSVMADSLQVWGVGRAAEHATCRVKFRANAGQPGLVWWSGVDRLALGQGRPKETVDALA